ncbi:VOC family protein [Actinomycetes bacterium KLBMP 9759]
MTTRTDPWPAGTPCWVDIAVPDLEAGTSFYSAVFGWTFVDTGEEYGHYSLAQTDGKSAAALGPVQDPGQPSFWTVYLASDDVDGTAKLITDNGGSLLFDPMDIPGNGRMCVALDSTGAAFGIWQSAGMIGAEIANEPGSLTWTDARLTDPAAGKDFYSAVFGYTYDPVPGAPDDYATFAVNGAVAGGIGGMMGSPEGVPSHWLSYFSVADVDTTIATAQSAGATVAMPAANTAFGRMAVLADPFGATFAVHQPPQR